MGARSLLRYVCFAHHLQVILESVGYTPVDARGAATSDWLGHYTLMRKTGIISDYIK